MGAACLGREQPDRVLYLAISWDTYRDFFTWKLIQDVIAEHQIKLLIFDPVKQEVVLWKE
ncbi:element excision factor XisH family protein [Calothrix sp. NIES-2098]|uniref:element excision factor XisH family protein n=1 Tax=Calothrix sp. NIES-2098 TaxID=1954171 RepID=UPI000B5E0CD3|nr:XisH protein [Calothrix sp. NIES-2098]